MGLSMEGVIDFHIHLGNTAYLECPVMVQLEESNGALYESVKKDMTDDPRALEDFLIGEGVDFAVMLPELHPLNNFNITTEMVAAYCKDSRILIPFAHINPNTEGDPVQKLKYYVNGLGCKGVKFLPSYQHFYINDQRLYPLYEVAQEMNVPVMFHIGSSTFPHAKLKFCDPLLLDEICVDFPELTVIACHGGRGFWYEAVFFLLSLHKNLHIDIAGLPPRKLLEYFPDLEKRSERFLFGTDWPTIPSTIKENIDAFKELSLSEENKTRILRDNARRVLKLEQA